MTEKLTLDVLLQAQKIWEAQCRTDHMIIYCGQKQAKEGIEAGLLRVRDDGLLELAI